MDKIKLRRMRAKRERAADSLPLLQLRLSDKALVEEAASYGAWRKVHVYFLTNSNQIPCRAEST